MKDAQERFKQKEIEIKAGQDKTTQETKQLQKEWRLTLNKLAPYAENNLVTIINLKIIDAFNSRENVHEKKIKKETKETLFLGGVYILSVVFIGFIGWLTFKGFTR